MPIPKTKLRPPTLRQPIVPRPRPLTVVSVPAGSGKTTLALEWLASSKGKVAWLSLDADDNDPIRFINGLIAALQVAGVKFQAPSGQRDLKAILTELINQLTDADAESITLVLDDYHLITFERTWRGKIRMPSALYRRYLIIKGKLQLFLRNSDINISISDLHRIRGDIYHGRQLHGFPRAHVKLAAMPRADDVKAFNITLPHWAVIMRAYVSNRKKLTGNVEDHNRLSFDLDKQSFACG